MSKENVRPFDLELAKQGHPLVTRNGKPAKFVAHVPDAHKGDQLIVLVDKTVYGYHKNGMWCNLPDEGHNLFLAPLGFCEGKPVFAGDVLVGTGYGTHPGEVVVDVNTKNIECYYWPKQKPVVETRMTFVDLTKAYNDGNSIRAVANKAIERAIADGDVIPASVVEKLFYKAITERHDGEYYSAAIEKVLKEYKEGLK